jgi:hypothetical protein
LLRIIVGVVVDVWIEAHFIVVSSPFIDTSNDVSQQDGLAQTLFVFLETPDDPNSSTSLNFI